MDRNEIGIKIMVGKYIKLSDVAERNFIEGILPQCDPRHVPKIHDCGIYGKFFLISDFQFVKNLTTGQESLDLRLGNYRGSYKFQFRDILEIVSSSKLSPFLRVGKLREKQINQYKNKLATVLSDINI